MKNLLILIIALYFPIISFGQKITYSDLSLTSEKLNEKLINSREYFIRTNEEFPYFQGKEDRKLIKFYKSTGNNSATIDFKTDTEHLSIIYAIQNNANFRFKFCTDYEDNIVYSYETSTGNKIRFDYSQLQISIDFSSDLNDFLDDNSEFGPTFICESDDAYAYHTNIKCNGLANCNENVLKTDIRSAKKINYKICEICTDDSYSKGRISKTYKNLNLGEEDNEYSEKNTLEEETEATNFYEMMDYSQVSFNRNVIAYTVTVKNKKNGIDGEEKMNEPNVNNPHYISFKSNKKDGGVLRIRNKNYSDIIINFKKVYQGPYEDGSTAYYFITNDQNYKITYFDEFGSNDFLFIELNQDPENGTSISYTISDI